MGDLIIEGKTKQVYNVPSFPGHCILLSKDRITAGDGIKAHNLAGKAEISNKTTSKVFEILSSVGKKTKIYKYLSKNRSVLTEIRNWLEQMTCF